ncbi:MAG TPA: kelch repeat-containing protein [Candidatus Sulfotelmatobacter sp.]|jgi:N-acetylneuraminic acid mutarotase|nr:kelch repeat-containing protein [Candidatus Sulfotelmatobacter sp.]
MKKMPAVFLAALLPALCSALLFASDEPKIPPMPAPLANNAVVVLKNGIEIYSLMGIGPKKTWDDITNKMYILRLSSKKWVEGRAVPGVAGRLGASAIAARGQIFVFGGFVVDGQGNEITVGDVNSFRPDDHRWYRAADIPVPVDAAVIGVFRDRYIYLVGGKSKTGPVNTVQVYDVEKNTWSQATPFPGTPVFGHAGGVAEDAIVFVDGAKIDPEKKDSGPTGSYVASDECWLGKIDKKDPNKIEWSKLPPHPGAARFGIFGGGGEKEHRVVFSGGTPTFHNFKGEGPDGKLGRISALTFVFDLHGNRWDTMNDQTPDPRTDGRGILHTAIGPLVLGGMLKNQAITANVMALQKK